MKFLASIMLMLFSATLVYAHPCPPKKTSRVAVGTHRNVGSVDRTDRRVGNVSKPRLRQWDHSVARRDRPCDPCGESHFTRNAVLLAAGAVGVGFLIHSLQDDDKTTIVYQPSPKCD